MTQNNQMQTQEQGMNKFKFNKIAGQFADTVSSQIMDVSSHITTQEAKRLTLALCVKANEALVGQNMQWSQVNANEFVVDALHAVTMGLDASNNEVYVIPYKTKGNKVDLDLTMSAWGWRKMIIKYGIGKKIVDLKAFTIRQNDKFSLKQGGTDDVWSYEPELFGTSPIVGYATVVCYEDGTSNVMTHSLDDIEKRHKASKAPNSPAWTKWKEEMSIAKAIRRHCKRIPYEMPTEMTAALRDVESEAAKRAAAREIEEHANTEELDFEELPQEVEKLPQQEDEPVVHEVIPDEAYEQMAMEYGEIDF